jgi:hypothetical protein
MPGLRFEDEFERILGAVLASPEIVAAGGGRPADTELEEWRRVIDRRTTGEQVAHLRADGEHSALRSRQFAYQNANMVLGIVAVLLAFLFVVLLISVAESSSPVVDVLLLTVFTGGLFLVVPRTAQDRERIQAWRDRLRIPSWSVEDAGRLTNAESTAETAHATWTRALEAAILARLRPRLGPGPYALTLQVRPDGTLPDGLRESHDSSYHVRTDTGRRLAHLIRDLQGGSLALVGARGTGKSDLIGALDLGTYAADGAAPVLTVVVRAPVSYVPRDFVLHLIAETCGRTIDHIDVRLANRQVAPGLIAEMRALRARADDERQRVLHQQTTSLETSAGGTAGTLQIGVRRNVSRARLASTYPELIAQLRALLESVVAVLQGDERSGVPIVIAIDELDRMENPQQAQAFLQELKGVLGVRSCCFIVSMADETLQAYDEAGQPLEAVLDRAFDEVVHMAYLDLPTCGRLLAGRVSPRLPQQFVGLCYCLAGGVARNVIRTARGIVGTALRPGHDRLASVTSAIVRAEARGHVNWARARLTRMTGCDVAPLVRFLDGWVHTSPADAGTGGWLVALLGTRLPPGAPDEMRRVHDHVLATAYFLLTVLDVFGDDLTEDRYDLGRRDEAWAGSFDSLARARRRLRANDALARDMLDAFRDAWRLPDAAQGAAFRDH